MPRSPVNSSLQEDPVLLSSGLVQPELFADAGELAVVARAGVRGTAGIAGGQADQEEDGGDA